jgi:hypothetical protein
MVRLMFDWKILAASFAALLVVSSVLVGGFGFTDILDKLNDWLGESPFGGFVAAPVRAVKPVTVILFPEHFELPLEGVSFSSGDASFEGFSGILTANLSSGTVSLTPGDNQFRVTLPLSELAIDDVRIGKLSLEDTDFHVISHALDTSGENVSLEVYDFSGRLSITQELVRLDGNVTSVRGNGKDIV